MKTAKLIHNPTAGEGGPSKDDLIAMVTSAGYDCSYVSVKEEGWRNEELGTADFIIAAGGDGTVKKVVGFLRDKNLFQKNLPLGLLPIGTANNIASALGIVGDQDQIIKSWRPENVRKYDVSQIHGVAGIDFFIEGFGYGIFPTMVQKMKEAKEYGFSEDELTKSLKVLKELIPTYPAKYCRIEMDNSLLEGRFLLVEVLNIPGIGPNLQLAPHADPGDGTYEVVLVAEQQRNDFLRYIEERVSGNRDASFFTTLKAKKIRMYSEETLIHVDDKLYDIKEGETVMAEILKDSLMFLNSTPN